jgi:two-component system response regulator
MSPPLILLVEDNDDDAELTMLAFKDANVAHSIVRTEDGVDALDYLFERGKYASRFPSGLPAFVLLDLKLPRVDGFEVLRQIRAHPTTRFLPVVVLTSSNEDGDRLGAYDGHANSYVQKPVDYDTFVTKSRDIGVYWTLTNIPPPAA